jgi:hypothetical protein
MSNEMQSAEWTKDTNEVDIESYQRTRLIELNEHIEPVCEETKQSLKLEETIEKLETN